MPRERAVRTELSSFSLTWERSMSPPWIKSRGGKTRGPGADSKNWPPPLSKREEEEEEAEGAVGCSASTCISIVPPARGPLGVGDHGRERRR